MELSQAEVCKLLFIRASLQQWQTAGREQYSRMLADLSLPSGCIEQVMEEMQPVFGRALKK